MRQLQNNASTKIKREELIVVLSNKTTTTYGTWLNTSFHSSDNIVNIPSFSFRANVKVDISAETVAEAELLRLL